jgi:hypothetical protein
MHRFGVARREQGITRPTWDTVLALSKALKVRCDAFLQEPADRPPTGRGRPPKPQQPEPANAKRPRGRPRKVK